MDLLETVGQCDNGYACVYQNNLSWSSPTTPLPAEAHPRVVFERLFGEGGTAADRRAALRRRASLLDWIREDTARLQNTLGADGPRESRPVSRDRPRGRASHPEGRGRDRRRSAARPRSADRRAGGVRRPRQADVRSAGARHAGGRDAGDHLPARARDEQPHLSRDRRPRSASSAHAPRERSRQDRADGEDQRVPRLAVRVLPREAEVDAGRRRLPARSLARALRQRHGQSQHPRSRQPADRRRRRRGRKGQGRPPHQVRGADAARQPPPDAARARRRPDGRLRRQPGQSR